MGGWVGCVWLSVQLVLIIHLPIHPPTHPPSPPAGDFEEEEYVDTYKEEEEEEEEEDASLPQEEPGEPLPYLPTAEEDLNTKMDAAEQASSSLEFLSKAVGERMLEEKFDVRVPYRPPRQSKPLPYQLDLLSYYAKEALRYASHPPTHPTCPAPHSNPLVPIHPPTHPSTHRARNNPEAIKIYKKCVELDPYDGRAYIGLARIEGRRRNGTAARAIYEEALRYCADNPFVLQAYGVFEQKNGDLRKAMELYDAAIKKGPKHSASWLGTSSYPHPPTHPPIHLPIIHQTSSI